MYEVEFSYPMGIWTDGAVWCGYCWTFEDEVEDSNVVSNMKQFTHEKLIKLLWKKGVLSIL